MHVLTFPLRAVIFTPVFIKWAIKKCPLDLIMVTFWLAYLAIFFFGVWSIFK